MDRRHLLKTLAGLALCPICAGGRALAEAGPWGYSGPKGPPHWGGVCASGNRQSPIDIASAARADMAELEIGWAESARTISNNGHTIEVASGGTMKRGSGRYRLIQFHFHHPSEHRINARPFPMEVHFVHAHQSGARGVVAALMTGGERNAAFARIVSAMPRQAGSSVPAPPGIDPNELLPSRLSYFAYPGSLTTPTPDCEENVTWMVLADAIEVAADDIAKFGALYRNNARPPQPLLDRRVQRSS